MSNSNKNIIFVEANLMNVSAKFQLYSPYGFRGDNFLNLLLKLSLSVAMANNQI